MMLCTRLIYRTMASAWCYERPSASRSLGCDFSGCLDVVESPSHLYWWGAGGLKLALLVSGRPDLADPDSSDSLRRDF